ncbi:ATP-grasp ribosomal peptide maturase [Streptomyces lunaelactis]|uniref:ATP-grasp ribosomal peptide maturase n=1 Tax=Streptomyces lunaelactis TaxID=1535768 RepID=A0A2R4T337_9ACTN|nr:ATP-grasp ribosomal peptide maturase [Streptomyces lunaelactis]AVZ73559.1 ATP-grasp ribosomal peptide maturase [Streptomyces lunaelactis]NUK84219.1 ATP-grasp ribosomal peptide maturase [Streptomyces lunaelactis]
MDNSPVLVVTALGDATADLVLDELYGRGVPAVRLDPGIDFPHPTRMSARIEHGAFTGDLDTATRHVDLCAVRSVYWRRPTPWGDPRTTETPGQRFGIEQSRAGYTGMLTALPRALHVNHPMRNRAADYKPGQLATAARLGLPVPATLFTNVPEDARKFAADHGPVIYKPVHGVQLAGEDGRNRTIWVRAVEADELDDSIALCPHLFQACVPKIADIRLAAVGDELFATRIDTDGDHLDWRQNQRLITCSPVTVPGPVREAVLSYLRTFGLTFGAFDFALDAADQWWFLECNPNGQWAFVDESTTRAIACALANTLEKGVPA